MPLNHKKLKTPITFLYRHLGRRAKVDNDREREIFHNWNNNHWQFIQGFFFVVVVVGVWHTWWRNFSRPIYCSMWGPKGPPIMINQLQGGVVVYLRNIWLYDWKAWAQSSNKVAYILYNNYYHIWLRGHTSSSSSSRRYYHIMSVITYRSTSSLPLLYNHWRLSPIWIYYVVRRRQRQKTTLRT